MNSFKTTPVCALERRASALLAEARKRNSFRAIERLEEIHDDEEFQLLVAGDLADMLGRQHAGQAFEVFRRRLNGIERMLHACKEQDKADADTFLLERAGIVRTQQDGGGASTPDHVRARISYGRLAPSSKTTAARQRRKERARQKSAEASNKQPSKGGGGQQPSKGKKGARK